MLCNLGTTTTTVQQSVPQTQTWPLFSESSAPILRPKLTCFVIYLFSRPPSWQLVRTPKVIRLHNTHTQFRSGTCSKTLPLGALHSLSRSLCVPENLLLFSFAQRFSSLCVTNLANSEIFAPLGSVPTVPVFTLTH